MSSFLASLFDAARDIYDTFVIHSDLYDFDLTEEEACDTAFYNSMATHAEEQSNNGDNDIPIGKRVY